MTSRRTTNRLLDLLEEGVIDPQQLIRACLTYMSEDEVRDMAESEGFLDFDDDDDSDSDVDLDVSTSDDDDN